MPPLFNVEGAIVAPEHDILHYARIRHARVPSQLINSVFRGQPRYDRKCREHRRAQAVFEHHFFLRH